MLDIGGREFFDERRSQFIETPKRTVRLEHSLRSVSRWESKWNTSFLSAKELTREQTVYYYWCMETTSNAALELFYYLTPEQEKEIQDYIASPMTATTISHRKRPGPNGKIVTSELIYYWMVYNAIPFDCDKWPLSRLLTLIEVCNAENGPKQKMSMRDQMAQQRALNNSRRAAHKTKG